MSASQIYRSVFPAWRGHYMHSAEISRYLQSIHPIAPSAYNIAKHQFARLPQSILHLRDDTLSQLLSLSNVRPGGRYMVVDDTGGLVTAAILERMGCVGRVMTFTDADSPPAWGVLNTMNFSERELACCKWLNWFQAEESWAPRKSIRNHPPP